MFEAGDCILKSTAGDTGSVNERKLAAAITDEVVEGSKKDIFSEVHGTLDLVLKKCGLEFQKDYRLRLGKSNFFFPGQQFEVLIGEEVLGQVGVVHPKVLKKFGWNHPTAMWEIDLVLL